MWIIILIIFLGIIFFTFSSKYSAIPFFPSNMHDMPRIVEGLDIQNNQIVIDMGAGTGTVVFEAARVAHEKNLNTQFVAIDINFILTGIMHIKKLFHPHRKYIQIATADLFNYDYMRISHNASHITYYMYVSPWLTDELMKLVKKTQKKSKIVSYYYPLKKMKETKRIKGLHDVFLYDV